MSQEDFLDFEKFEPILLKKCFGDVQIFSIICNHLTHDILSKMDYKIVLRFYDLYFKKYSKLPTHDEILLSKAYKSHKSSFDNVFDELKYVKCDDVNVEYFYNGAEKFIKFTKACNCIKKITEQVGDGKGVSTEDVVADFEKISAIKFIHNIGTDIKFDVERFLTHLDDDLERIPTGFVELDSYMNGGYYKNGEFLGLVAGASNTGKSIFLSNLAVNACKSGRNVVLVSLEMSEMVYSSRVYADLLSIPILDLKYNKETIRKRVSGMGNGNIIIKEFPPSSLTVSELEAYLDEVERSGFKIDVLVLDYLSLMSAGSDRSLYESGKVIAEGLRRVSYRGFPVWSALQIGRDGMKDNTPKSHHVAESIAPLQISDFMLILHSTEEESHLNHMNFIIAKSRLGKKDLRTTVYFDNTMLKFTDLGGGLNTFSNGIGEDLVESLNLLSIK